MKPALPAAAHAPEAGRTALRVLGGVVGLVLSVALVLSAFYRVDLTGPGAVLTPRFPLLHFLAEIPSQLRWLLPFVLLCAAILPLRALQWQRTLARKVPFKERYHVVAIGAFVHNALPGKMGDIFRAFLLARTQSIPFVEVLGSVAVCKLLEFAALMGLVALALLGPLAASLSRFSGALRGASGVCLLLLVLVTLLARFAHPLALRLERRGRLPRVRTFLLHVGDGLGAARSLRGMLAALLFSFGPVLAPALGYGLALHGLGVQGGLFAGTVVLGAIALGQATPGIPVGMGVYYFVTSWTARSLGASEDAAAAFSVLTHLGTFLTQTAVGAASVWLRKLRWRDLKVRRSLAADAARAMTTPGAVTTR